MSTTRIQVLSEDEEEERNGSKDFPPNETDETCPICLEAYDREIGRLKDGIQNSGYESNCPHWCCCMCWDTMYKQNNDTYSCPICKMDITDWLKTHYDSDDDEEEEDLPTCCGKHCDETEGLKLGMGWNRWHSSVKDMITEQLWCENCYKDCVGSECKSCSEYFPYTEMTYKEGGGFGEACYCYDQFFCKSCVASISSIDYDLDEYA
jgi:hypothetical protein